jgi:hypothetical protein
MNGKNRESKQDKWRKASLLDEVLERRMVLYALAAGAALAGASGAAQAKVVFTPSNVTLAQNQSLSIDLANDGTVNFTLANQLSPGRFRRQGMQRPPGSNAWGDSMYVFGATASDVELEQPPVENSQQLAAFESGARIGSDRPRKQEGLMAEFFSYYGTFFVFGPFANVKQRYLGVRFLINGNVHYGWIGFRSITDNFMGGVSATLLGWAYETEPDTPILAGMPVMPPELGSLRTSDPTAAGSSEPTSLELLAAGHVAVADWRRRRAA